MNSSESLEVILFGAARCHKTQFYIQHLNDNQTEYTFCDVKKDKSCEEALRNLYENNKLHFPTFLIQDRKLRNPSIDKLNKFLLLKQ